MKKRDFEQLTLFPAGSPASRSVQPGSAAARRMTVSSGQKCLELSKNCGPLGSLEKMLLGSRIWRSTTCWLTWKPRVTKRGRLWFQLAVSVPRTEDTGLQLLPTPTASLGKHGGPWSRDSSGRPGLQLAAMIWPTPTATDYRTERLKSSQNDGTDGNDLQTEVGGTLNPDWVEWLMGFPIGWTDIGMQNRIFPE